MRIYGPPVFAELFAPLFSRLQGLYWITLEDAFRFPPVWVDASDFDPDAEVYTTGPCARFYRDVHLITEGNTTYGHATDIDLFPAYAPAIHEDWNAIFGLRARPVSALEWLKGFYDSKDRPAYVAACHVAFLNVDNAWWEFYAQDAELERVLRAHLATLEISVDDLSLADNPLLMNPPDAIRP